jgi:hypothetical protein
MSGHILLPCFQQPTSHPRPIRSLGFNVGIQQGSTIPLQPTRTEACTGSAEAWAHEGGGERGVGLTGLRILYVSYSELKVLLIQENEEANAI